MICQTEMMNASVTPVVGSAVGDPSNQFLVWVTVVVLVVIAVVAVVAAIWVARVTRPNPESDDGQAVGDESGSAGSDDEGIPARS
ncbi:MAG: hypothetical protein CSA55_02435 [Ilumatobacter coccineus]|uniref:Uncharacterized protein n=1 Tax=Ilumatobacter coccineus TaxID=467094 RepID=A0A2G6KBN7_9ACTN|nr:MAG: hypothetical protein CSA55_02435 [Ilumatobacter coccineus]